MSRKRRTMATYSTIMKGTRCNRMPVATAGSRKMATAKRISGQAASGMANGFARENVHPVDLQTLAFFVSLSLGAPLANLTVELIFDRLLPPRALSHASTPKNGPSAADLAALHDRSAPLPDTPRRDRSD